MTLGLPLVAFNVGRISDIVEHNKDGYLLDYLDIDGFSKKLIELISDSEKYKMMQNNCYRKAKNYKWGNIKNIWYEVYDR